VGPRNRPLGYARASHEEQRMGVIMVGTASWTDKSLIDAGTFYPRKSMSADARLRFYASRFPIVEVDSSYYALPSAQNAALWAERTPEGFVFDVKAFRLFTGHHTAAAVLPKDVAEQLPPPLREGKTNVYYKDLPAELAQTLWARFREAIEPLRAAGKLGLVLFQFPPWVFFFRKAFDHLLHCQAVSTQAGRFNEKPMPAAGGAGLGRATLIAEGQIHAGPVFHDLVVLDTHVELLDLGNTQIA
jgi:uncharacterized protein YecE (DUF72 family)